MARNSILKEGQSYTFSKYFELTVDPEELLAEFGFELKKSPLTLERFAQRLDWGALSGQIQADLRYVDLTSETARREVLVAPILLFVCRLIHSKLKIEYALNVNEHLKGNLDYYMQAQGNLLVIEAKQADLTRGFTQLATELIALDQWTDSDAPIIYGAVTTGDIWKFGILERGPKRIVQDLNLYRVPTDLEDLLRILLGILN